MAYSIHSHAAIKNNYSIATGRIERILNGEMHAKWTMCICKSFFLNKLLVLQGRESQQTQTQRHAHKPDRYYHL